MHRKMQIWFLALFIMTGLMLGSCAQQAPDTGTATTQSSVPEQVPDRGQRQNALPRLEGMATVELTIDGSRVAIEVDGTNAPITAGNFVDLVHRGVYDGLMFHRVVREPDPFVVQGGDPKSKDPNVPAQRLGSGGFVDPVTQRARYIPLEIKPDGAQEPLYSQLLKSKPPQLKHSRGAVAMARSQMPDSASSQFYIALANLAFLDGSYAVFGYVTEGMDVVDKIQQGDRITAAKVTQGLQYLKTSEN